MGQLSFVTAFLTFGGSAARVFTTLKEVSDVVSIYCVVSGVWLAAVHKASVVWGEAAGELGLTQPERVRRRVLHVLRVAILLELEGLGEEFAARAGSAVAVAVSIVPGALSQRRRVALRGSRTR